MAVLNEQAVGELLALRLPLVVIVGCLVRFSPGVHGADVDTRFEDVHIFPCGQNSKSWINEFAFLSGLKKIVLVLAMCASIVWIVF